MSRVIMISGANRGIGKAIALKLYQQGFFLSLGVRHINALPTELLCLAQEKVLFTSYDANDSLTEPKWIEKTLQKFNKIDGLVNNAGIYYSLDIEDDNDVLLDNMLAINTKAPIRLTRLVLPYLRQSGEGRIINIVSDAAKRVDDSKVGYSISKAGFLAASHAMLHAAKKDGVRVTALCPAWVNTHMAESYTPLLAELKIQPETIAEIVLMLINLPNTAVISEIFIDNLE